MPHEILKVWLSKAVIKTTDFSIIFSIFLTFTHWITFKGLSLMLEGVIESGTCLRGRVVGYRSNHALHKSWLLCLLDKC
jgi:hypothetical protein